MNAQLAELLRSIEPADLGRRVRAARIEKGLTQGQLAGSDVSVGYVSRIESGQRRPDARVLAMLAARLELPAEQLLLGAAPREVDEVRLALDYAELSLESGEPKEAEAHSAEALARSVSLPVDDLTHRARLVHARALEGLGRLDDAIIELEELIGDAPSGVVQIRAGIALCRAYRESGDLAKAIEAGERILDRLTGTPLAQTDEAVQLSLTLAAAYFERGDAGHAVRVCRRALKKAECLGSPAARAAAYWNASILEADRGATGDAVILAERALALLGEGQDTRNLARLRTALGTMQLRLDPPEVAEAQRHLEKAAEELAWSSASPVDRARNDIALARAHFLAGDVDAALDLAQRVHARVRDEAPVVAADAMSLAGQAVAARGDTDGAARCYLQAVHTLTAVGADRYAAQLWFEVAELLERVGLLEASRDAYRSAATSAGVRGRTTAATQPARDTQPVGGTVT